MPKTAMIRARVEPHLKNEVENIFSQLGITTTEAISLFFHQVKRYKGIPLDLRIPNQTSKRAIHAARLKKGLKKFTSVDDMVSDLDS